MGMRICRYCNTITKTEQKGILFFCCKNCINKLNFKNVTAGNQIITGITKTITFLDKKSNMKIHIKKKNNYKKYITKLLKIKSELENAVNKGEI